MTISLADRLLCHRITRHLRWPPKIPVVSEPAPSSVVATQPQVLQQIVKLTQNYALRLKQEKREEDAQDVSLLAQLLSSGNAQLSSTTGALIAVRPNMQTADMQSWKPRDYEVTLDPTVCGRHCFDDAAGPCLIRMLHASFMNSCFWKEAKTLRYFNEDFASSVAIELRRIDYGDSDTAARHFTAG